MALPGARGQLDDPPRPGGTRKFGLVRMTAFEVEPIAASCESWADPWRCGSCRWVPQVEDFGWDPDQTLVQCRLCGGYRCAWCRLEGVPECVNCKPLKERTEASPSTAVPRQRAVDSFCSFQSQSRGASSSKATVCLAGSSESQLDSQFDYSGDEVYCKVCFTTFCAGQEAEHTALCGKSCEGRLGSSSSVAAACPTRPAGPVGASSFDYSGDEVYCKVCCATFGAGQEAKHAALCGKFSEVLGDGPSASRGSRVMGHEEGHAALCGDGPSASRTGHRRVAEMASVRQPLGVAESRKDVGRPATARSERRGCDTKQRDAPRFNWWHPDQFRYGGSLSRDGDRNSVYCTVCKVTFNRGQEGTHGSGRRHSQLMEAPWPELFCPGRAGSWSCNTLCRCSGLGR